MNNIPDHIAAELERWERRSYEEEFGPAPELDFDAVHPDEKTCSRCHALVTFGKDLCWWCWQYDMLKK
jgi:hypothetical protein